MRIAVAGGAGSIGSELVRELVGQHEVCVFDYDEYGLYRLAVEIPGLKLICGDVRNMDDLRPLQNWQPDVIYNCAALKHITFCEDNPAVAHDVNCMGTWNLLQIARVILLSTDKAVEPTSELGRSKMMAERLVLDTNGGVVVRLCNVSRTRGNFFETASIQAAAGRPITITSEEVTRWYMSKENAVDILERALREPDGTVIVPGPSAVVLVNIAARIRELFPGHEISVVGLREGEKIHEFMTWPCERTTGPTEGKLYVVVSGTPVHDGVTAAPVQSATETAGP